jgi:hypothetical protein
VVKGHRLAETALREMAQVVNVALAKRL